MIGWRRRQIGTTQKEAKMSVNINLAKPARQYRRSLGQIILDTLGIWADRDWFSWIFYAVWWVVPSTELLAMHISGEESLLRLFLFGWICFGSLLKISKIRRSKVRGDLAKGVIDFALTLLVVVYGTYLNPV